MLNFRSHHLKLNTRTNPLVWTLKSLFLAGRWNLIPIYADKLRRLIRSKFSAQAELKVWDSGKITNDSSVAIQYEGEALKAATKYDWQVSVWNQQEKIALAKSWFETGLLNPDPKLSAWDGADWIGGSDNDLVFYPHYLSVFKFSYEVQLDRKTKSLQAAFIFGANGWETA